MIKVRDFRCPNGHVWEDFLPTGQEESFCKDCGSKGEKLMAAPRFVLEGTSGAFPTALQKWEARHPVFPKQAPSDE